MRCFRSFSRSLSRGAVLGLWQADSGTADHALERYVTGIVGIGRRRLSTRRPLQSYVHDASGEPVMRYAPYIKTKPYATSAVSPLLVVAELVSLFVSLHRGAARARNLFRFDVPRFRRSGRFGIYPDHGCRGWHRREWASASRAQMIREYFLNRA